MMQSLLIAFVLVSVTFGQELRSQPNLAGLRGLEFLSPFFGSIPQNDIKPALASNLELLNFLNNGLTPTNPGLDLLAHGIGFGIAALRGLGIIMQDNQRNYATTQQ